MHTYKLNKVLKLLNNGIKWDMVKLLALLKLLVKLLRITLVINVLAGT